ncbi:hypothetical protein Pelo_11500 [Pelomyxa schiedti]|nr:hypothetical protein Pelo_11500 [Pelomyxa schiedti]
MSREEIRRREAGEANGELPRGFRVGVLGDTSDMKPEITRGIAEHVATAFSADDSFVLVTGGTPGVPANFAHVFVSALSARSPVPGNRVWHILPRQSKGMGTGDNTPIETTLFYGDDMADRRAILAALCDVYISIGGGPGCVDEITRALGNGKAVLPIVRSGGASGDCGNHKSFSWGVPTVPRPEPVSASDWAILIDPASTKEQTEAATLAALTALKTRS